MKYLKRFKKAFPNFKSSILGLVLMSVSVYVIINNTGYNEYLIGGVLISGVMLLFAPDKYINLIEKVIIGRVLLDDKKESPEPNPGEPKI